MTLAAAGPSPLWYLTRGTGIVTLVLLTASVVLGIVQVRRWAPPGSPRFVFVTLHRAISLLVTAFLAVHVATAVLDSFAPIRLIDVLVPFAGAYRPLWLGLGAVALDLLVALTVTSLLRHRLGLRAWRAVHWLAYACWPVALVHGWGTGSDARTTWMLTVTIGCAAAVLAAVAWRLTGQPGPHASLRAAALGACAALAAAAGIWLTNGPLGSGWARRAGTPTRLLASTGTATAPAARSSARRAQPRAAPVPALERPFSSRLQGTVHRGFSAAGTAVIDLRMRLTGGVPGVLRVRLAGQPAQGGGVIMSRSAVTLGPRSAPGELQGRIDSLQGASLEALVAPRTGAPVRLRVDLSLSQNAVSGVVSGQPLAGTVG
jgi:hypothetical protein